MVTMNDDAWTRFVFRDIGGNAYMWLRTAKRLIRAADLLLPAIESEWDMPEFGHPRYDHQLHILPVYMLLVGFAIENLIKGVHVARDPNIVDDARLRKLKKHKLHELFKEIDVTLSQDESYLIERLHYFITWAGRYPIPLEYKTLLPRPRGEPPVYTFSLGGPPVYTFPADIPLSKKLMHRLEDVLVATLADQGKWPYK